MRKANYHPEIWKAQLGELWQKVQKQGVLSLSKKQIALIQRDLAKKELLAIDGIAGKKTQRAIAHFIPKLANLKSAIQEAALESKQKTNTSSTVILPKHVANASIEAQQEGESITTSATESISTPASERSSTF